MKYIKNLILKNTANVPDEEIFQALAKDVIEGLDVDLVSIWYFNDDYSVLTCKYSLDRNKTNTLKNQTILEKNYPNYFSSIIKKISLNAQDVYTDPMTKELADDYFEPNKIYSLLDYLICEGDQKIGVICCETTSAKRAWKEADIDLIRALTVMVGAELKKNHQN